MPDTDFAGLRAVVVDAVHQPEFPAVQRRAGRLRNRRRVAVSALAAAVVAAVAVGVAVRDRDRALPEPAQPQPVGRVTMVQGGDIDHLYVTTYPICDEGTSAAPQDDCGQRVYAWEGGSTWRRVVLPADAGGDFLGVRGPDLLVLTASTDPARAYVSGDGGRRWLPLAPAPAAVEAVPAGGAPYGCEEASRTALRCVVTVLDPATGRQAALAKQPPVEVAYPPRPGAGTEIWVDGIDPASRRPAVAWSRDGGRSWSTHVFAGEPAADPDFNPPQAQIQTAGGPAVYVFLLSGRGEPSAYRSGDGGATWAALPDTGRGFGRWSLVAADGAHVVADADNSGRYQASRDGGPYEPVELTGLPPITAVPTTVTGGYVTTAESDPSAFYLSTDGYAWRRIPVT
jgi:hypothetical protein